MYLKFVQLDGPQAMEFHQLLGFTKSLDTEHYIKIEFQTMHQRGNEEDEPKSIVRSIHGDDPQAYDVLYVLNDDGQTIETIRALPESIASMTGDDRQIGTMSKHVEAAGIDARV